jgi:cation diffusion facilitator family transporter
LGTGHASGRASPSALSGAVALRAFHHPAPLRHKARSHAEGSEKLPIGVSGVEDEANLQEAQRATYLGLGKNVVLTAGKGIVGVTANSSALIADAVHSLSDIVADLVALATLRVSRLPADRMHPYGHGKYEPIGALCVSSMLVAAGGGLVWHSAMLVHSAEAMAVPGAAALWISVAAIGLNEALFHITLRAGKKSRSQTVIANAWHHRSDALSSLVAMAGIGGAMAGFPMLDPLAGGAVGLMIAKTGGEIGWESVRDLTDSQDEEVLQTLETVLSAVPGVSSCKYVRHRRMGPYQVVDAHVVVEREISVSAASHVVAKCRAAVRAEMPEVTEMMVHVTPALHGARGRQPSQSARNSAGSTMDQATEPELEGLRSHREIEQDVRTIVSSVPDVKWIEHVHVHYIGGAVQVIVLPCTPTPDDLRSACVSLAQHAACGAP